MRHIKVIVHTKSGKKLAYFAAAEKTVEEIDKQWGIALSQMDSVSFGSYTMPVSSIDYVEILG